MYILSDDFKIGFSFATLASLLSDNKDDDVFSSVSGSNGIPDRYSVVLNALKPADFAYSTAAFKLEYIRRFIIWLVNNRKFWSRSIQSR